MSPDTANIVNIVKMDNLGQTCKKNILPVNMNMIHSRSLDVQMYDEQTQFILYGQCSYKMAIYRSIV